MFIQIIRNPDLLRKFKKKSCSFCTSDCSNLLTKYTKFPSSFHINFISQRFVGHLKSTIIILSAFYF